MTFLWRSWLIEGLTGMLNHAYPDKSCVLLLSQEMEIGRQVEKKTLRQDNIFTFKFFLFLTTIGWNEAVVLSLESYHWGTPRLHKIFVCGKSLQVGNRVRSMTDKQTNRKPQILIWYCLVSKYIVSPDRSCEIPDQGAGSPQVPGLWNYYCHCHRGRGTSRDRLSQVWRYLFRWGINNVLCDLALKYSP